MPGANSILDTAPEKDAAHLADGWQRLLEDGNNRKGRMLQTVPLKTYA
jgi:hypothetical protein